MVCLLKNSIIALPFLLLTNVTSCAEHDQFVLLNHWSKSREFLFKFEYNWCCVVWPGCYLFVLFHQSVDLPVLFNMFCRRHIFRFWPVFCIILIFKLQNIYFHTQVFLFFLVFFSQLISLMKSLHLLVEKHKYHYLILASLILAACYRYIVLVVLVQYN